MKPVSQGSADRQGLLRLLLGYVALIADFYGTAMPDFTQPGAIDQVQKILEGGEDIHRTNDIRHANACGQFTGPSHEPDNPDQLVIERVAVLHTSVIPELLAVIARHDEHDASGDPQPIQQQAVAELEGDQPQSRQDRAKSRRRERAPELRAAGFLRHDRIRNSLRRETSERTPFRHSWRYTSPWQATACFTADSAVSGPVDPAPDSV